MIAAGFVMRGWLRRTTLACLFDICNRSRCCARRRLGARTAFVASTAIGSTAFASTAFRRMPLALLAMSGGRPFFVGRDRRELFTPRDRLTDQLLDRGGRSESRPRPEAPSRAAPAPVANIEQARKRRPPQPMAHDEADSDHLPAFLLRPVPVKA